MNTGQPIQSLANEDLQKNIKIIVGSIAVMTGVQIEPDMMVVTLGTVKRFLRDNFGFLTPAEVTKAFELNSTGIHWKRVQHYNRNLNCDYIGEVLQNYREYRAGQLKEIAAVYSKTEQMLLQAPAPEVMDTERAEVLESAYAMYRNNQQVPFIASGLLYEYAVLLKLVPEEEAWQEYISIAKAKLIARTYTEIQSIRMDERKDGDRFALQRLLDQFNGHEPYTSEGTIMLNEAAKEIYLRNMFRKLVDGKKETIFA